jgi:hypothetical protein
MINVIFQVVMAALLGMGSAAFARYGGYGGGYGYRGGYGHRGGYGYRGGYGHRGGYGGWYG